jgi:hypothetical protein
MENGNMKNSNKLLFSMNAHSLRAAPPAEGSAADEDKPSGGPGCTLHPLRLL